MFLLLFLFFSRATRVLAGIERWHHGFRGEFSVIHHGRMPFHTVLMFLKDLELLECIDFCIKHRQCKSISYEKSLKECELNDMEFDDVEGDRYATGWINYSSPPMVHGGFSDWIQATDCSNSCGEGTKIFYRLCDNPRPKFGGEGCEGDDHKVVPCNLGPCNLALEKPSFLSGDYDLPDRPELLAKYANDGDLTSKAVSNFARKAYWYVNLQSPIKIRLIRLYLQEYAKNRNFYQGLAVYTTTGNIETKWELCKMIGTPEKLILDVKCVNETIAEIVVVTVDGNAKKSLYLREVEVYE